MASHAATFENDIRPVLDQYCVKCHGGEKTKGDVNFKKFTNTTDVLHGPEVWLKAITQLREHNMPPEGKTQPSEEQRELAARWIEDTFDNPKLIARDPGRKIIHRLNRVEYNNTVRDLLGVDTKPADKFPADGGGGGGFDNNAETLFVPPILMEKYFAAADEILAKAKPETIFQFHTGTFTSQRSAVRKNLEHFARRAYRRPVTGDDLNPLLALYDRSRKSGESDEASTKLSFKAILISPDFLFRVEMDRTGKTPSPLNDYELATRLSYFLWSSMPDDELFKLASQKKLHQPATLKSQVARMLADAKAKSFADNFMSQWLGIRRLETSLQPEGSIFPTYTPALRQSMLREPVEFFYSLLHDDSSLTQLLKANYTYVDETLAKHYGLTNITGQEMRRVALTDPNRGGVLSMASVLTLTSYPQRTSPVLRGRWVLDEIFGTPPPPPPPVVPSLSADDKPLGGETFRQRLEKHRSKPECASCHARMDPLGFGLENFDAIGRWRTEIGGKPVDSAGQLTTGEKFQGAAELKELLMTRKDAFVRNFGERMLAYALGRGLEYYDRPALKQIMSALAKDDYRSSTLILQIVQSYPFQYRRGSDAEPPKS